MNPPFDADGMDARISKTDTDQFSIPAEDRPCFHVAEDWFTVKEHGKLKPGVWYFGTKATKDEISLTCTPVCSPLYIDAVTCDKSEHNFGRLIRIKNTRGQWREWAMPMELTSGAAELLHKELLSMGTVIYPKSKMLLSEYLVHRTPTRRVLCATQVGWLDNWFVLPDEVLGTDGEDVVFQGPERGQDQHSRAGDLNSWRTSVASLSHGNPLLILALSAAFAGPLLQRCNGEGGGIHFVGDSSTGKTTLLDAACSVWGGTNYKRSWSATANGLEGAASLFNDCLFGIDEISQCDPREVGAIVYALGNGVGKQRAARAGNARPVTRWRCMVLSSGERSVSTSMAEGGFRIKAGQGVRLLDVNATRRYGAFDDLHGRPNGAALADAVKLAASQHHGHAGRAFVRKLINEMFDWSAKLDEYKRKPEFISVEGEGQDKRASARFALIALAGEAARAYGLTGWSAGDACNAAAVGLQAWRESRSRSNSETTQIIEQLRAFIEKHGDSRFSDVNSDADRQVRDRAGWWNDDTVEMYYLFTAEGLKEALKGFDFKRALDCLQEAGALPHPDAHGQRSKAHRIRGRVVRLYPVRAEKLEQ